MAPLLLCLVPARACQTALEARSCPVSANSLMLLHLQQCLCVRILLVGLGAVDHYRHHKESHPAELTVLLLVQPDCHRDVWLGIATHDLKCHIGSIIQPRIILSSLPCVALS